MSQALCKTALPVVMVLAFYVSGFAVETTSHTWAQEPEQVTEKAPNQAEKIGPSPNLEAEIHAGPKDIKEEVGIFVFLGWLWFSVFVMIYLLRQKIREVDRLHSYKYFTVSEKKPSL